MQGNSSRRDFLKIASVGAVTASSVTLPAMARHGTASQASDIEDCATITESGEYQLVSDITHDGDPEVCIRIEASDVTLDGRGYAIRGPGDGRGLGIMTLPDARNVTVEHLEVTGMINAIVLRGPQSRFDRIVATRNDLNGFHINPTATGTTITNSDISRNHSSGIAVVESGDHLFQYNTLVSNDGSGLFFQQGSSHWDVRDNTLSHNKGLGVLVYDGGDGNVIADNVVASNGGNGEPTTGVSINEFSPARAREWFIARNTISANGEDGLFLRQVEASRVAWNAVSRNGDDGIELDDADDNIVKRNVVLANGDDAIVISSDSTGNRVWGNRTGW